MKGWLRDTPAMQAGGSVALGPSLALIVVGIAFVLICATFFPDGVAAEAETAGAAPADTGIRVVVRYSPAAYGTTGMAWGLAEVDATVLDAVPESRTVVASVPSFEAFDRLAARAGVTGAELDVRVRLETVSRSRVPRNTTTTTTPVGTTSTTVAPTTTTAPPTSTTVAPTTTTAPATTTTAPATTTTAPAPTTTVPRRGGRTTTTQSPPPTTTTTLPVTPTTTTTTASTTSTTAPQSTQVTPWGIARVGAPSVWSDSSAVRRGAGVNVAVLDTGIDLDHPDLAANIEGGFMAITGVSPLPQSYDDDNGHGTHVAGVIAAVDDLAGVVGVAPEADLYAVKVLDSEGSGWLSDIARAVYWAIDTHRDADPGNDIQIINMSLGADVQSSFLRSALADAEAAGILLVAAAGNDGAAVDYPAAEPTVVAVGATDQNDSVPSWSSRGPEVELVAPGVLVQSTYPGGVLAWKNGTSSATPHVVGAAALLWGARPDLTADEVRALLGASAQDLGAPGWDSLTGHGLLRVDLAFAR